ncbi:anthranilate synthase component I [Alkalibacillus haloalkaliphilus]|uniref:anthranilate synthase component I n=1 Tax=Alkalibacillus haloalkaliphilus TaxID=94136 RepID=UPI002936A7D3|nr:anthranilate synthase component I [Alkalibacillus haloalkaliphilus]MDV2582978.1 anthranilate synthase component I [Alkalibacillus haloalkaliphilus]
MVQYKHEVIEGDQHTPISIFQKLNGEKKFLLESSLKHEKTGRYSLIGENPYYEFKAFGKEITEINLQTNKISTKHGDPIQSLSELVKEGLTLPFDIPFTSGGVGYIAYDIAKQFEPIGFGQYDDLSMPDIHFMFYEKVIVYDHLLQNVHCFIFDQWITNEKVNLETEMKQLINQINSQTAINKQPFTLGEFKSHIPKKEYLNKVQQIKDQINEGEIFQAVLSQRLTAEYEGDPFSYYRQLRKNNPSPYMYFIDFDDYHILGASPESLVKVRDNQVTTNPIAGTRKRGHTREEDLKLENELLTDEKEIAEHQMLVDLGRNDIGRVAQPGTIELTKYMAIERYRFVMHIVSEVTGMLDKNVTPLDALKACLPAGTVSGAPKIRAMQIINNLEPTKRGPYSGAVGYLSINGNFDFALAIRTMILKDQLAHVQAGAGVVFDSIPESEYEETLNKAKTLMEVN